MGSIFVSRKVTNIKYKPLKITTMKKMLVLSFALSLFAVSSVMANDSTLDADRSPKRVNVNLVIGTPPPPPHNCCDHHRPAPPKHNCCKRGHKHHNRAHRHFDGPRPKPGHGAPGVRPHNGGHRPPVGGPRPGNGNHNEPPRGGNRR